MTEMGEMMFQIMEGPSEPLAPRPQQAEPNWWRGGGGGGPSSAFLILLQPFCWVELRRCLVSMLGSMCCACGLGTLAWGQGWRVGRH